MGSCIYILDYNTPREPASKRVQFYRDLRKMSTSLKYSTRSVFHTEEKELAEAVYWLVIACAEAINMYKGKEVTLIQFSDLKK